MRIEIRRSDHQPLPSDINEVDERYQIGAKDLYQFWLGLLDERQLSLGERIKRGNEFFDRHFSGNEVGSWLEERDSEHLKTRAILIKELAYQDWDRVHSGKRNNPPSSWYPSN
jgi:hypothetical protein